MPGEHPLLVGFTSEDWDQGTFPWAENLFIPAVQDVQEVELGGLGIEGKEQAQGHLPGGIVRIRGRKKLSLRLGVSRSGGRDDFRGRGAPEVANVVAQEPKPHFHWIDRTEVGQEGRHVARCGRFVRQAE